MMNLIGLTNQNSPRGSPYGQLYVGRNILTYFIDDRIAQVVEQWTFNPRVVGSSPTAVIFNMKLPMK